jgi:signal-transduction protein with cAMP-binding, CBS, and nucleotidyltransferase domain
MVDSADLIARMGKLRQFEKLSSEQIESILAAGQIRPYTADTTLFREEEPCAGVFVLVQGQGHL